MARNPRREVRAAVPAALGLVAILVAIGGAVAAARGGWSRRPAYLDMPRGAAARADLFPSIHAGGDVDSAQRVIVECELDGGQLSQILEIVPDGTTVAKGQVMARLDASQYEETARLLEILVLQSRADEQKAEFDLRTAEIALKEYREGLLKQYRELYQSQIVLHDADIRRQGDRLRWAEGMVAKGYSSRGQLLSEQSVLERSQANLKRVRGELATMNDYSSGLQIERMESEVFRVRREFEFQTLRREHREAQLKDCRARIESCTIRAPFAARAVYATAYNRELKLEPGAVAYNGMDLFYLPNLEELEVQTEIHETMIGRVKAGQAVKIRVNGLPQEVLEGHIKTVSLLPKEPRNWHVSRDVRNFLAKIAIHAPPPGLLPGRTASVEIVGDPRHDVLCVPSTAVRTEEGRDVVYVPTGDRLERRVVEVAPADRWQVEVVSGVGEGEEVILDPALLVEEDVRAAETILGPAAIQAGR